MVPAHGFVLCELALRALRRSPEASTRFAADARRQGRRGSPRFPESTRDAATSLVRFADARNAEIRRELSDMRGHRALEGAEAVGGEGKRADAVPRSSRTSRTEKRAGRGKKVAGSAFLRHAPGHDVRRARRYARHARVSDGIVSETPRVSRRARRDDRAEARMGRTVHAKYESIQNAPRDDRRARTFVSRRPPEPPQRPRRGGGDPPEGEVLGEPP